MHLGQSVGRVRDRYAGRCLGDLAMESIQYRRGPREGLDDMNTQELAKAFTDLCAKGELEAAG